MPRRHAEVADAEHVPIARRHTRHDGEFKPHESPPIMLIPLVVLGGLAVLAGLMQLPSLGFIPDEYEHRLEAWLHPVVEYGEADIHETWAYDHLVFLLSLAIACRVGRHRDRLADLPEAQGSRRSSRTLFAEGWYYDKAITWFMGNPGRRRLRGCRLVRRQGGRWCRDRHCGGRA